MIQAHNIWNGSHLHEMGRTTRFGPHLHETDHIYMKRVAFTRNGSHLHKTGRIYAKQVARIVKRVAWPQIVITNPESWPQIVTPNHDLMWGGVGGNLTTKSKNWKTNIMRINRH